MEAGHRRVLLSSALLIQFYQEQAPTKRIKPGQMNENGHDKEEENVSQKRLNKKCMRLINSTHTPAIQSILTHFVKRPFYPTTTSSLLSCTCTATASYSLVL